MANINFPSNPSVGQIYDFGVYRYRYDGEKWTTIPTNGQTINQVMDAHKAGLDQHPMSGVQGLNPVIATLQSRITELESWPQTGSNTNGNWVKHRDGTMECWKVFSGSAQQAGVTTQGIVYGQPLPPQTFPLPFIGIPEASVSFMPTLVGGAFWASYNIATTTTKWPGAYPFSELPITGNPAILINLYAIGRWK